MTLHVRGWRQIWYLLLLLKLWRRVPVVISVGVHVMILAVVHSERTVVGVRGIVQMCVLLCRTPLVEIRVGKNDFEM